MSKMKTHSGAKKRFRVTGSGKVKAACAGRKHFLRRRSQKMKREARQGMYLFKSDADNIRKIFLPNS